MLLFRFVSRKGRFLVTESRSRRGVCRATNDGLSSCSGAQGLSRDLDENTERMVAALGGSSDVITRKVRFGAGGLLVGAIVFIQNLVDAPFVAEGIVRPLLAWRPRAVPMSGLDIVDELLEEVLCAGAAVATERLEELSDGCLSGSVALFVDGAARALLVPAIGWEKRQVTEPMSETVVKGPREGFTENLDTNISLLRRKLRTSDLKIEFLRAGRMTRTGICIMYLGSVANPDVVDEVRLRIARMDMDSVLETGYVEEYIEDAPFSPFPTVGYSEKPDTVAGRMLEGRTAILVDGTPFVLTVPMLFIESFQTAEDHYVRMVFSNLKRLLRFVAYGIAVFAPGIYIALTAFHQELIPTRLLFSIAAAKEGVPFPAFFEALLMVFMYEIMREAGIRLPRPIGQAISIVGALVIGDAAISAGLVGAPMLITVALMAIASFVVPQQNESASILRPIMMGLGATLGWFGIFMGFLAVLTHLATLTSFGVPYFDGLLWTSDLQDSVTRAPLWKMEKRPRYIARLNLRRRGPITPPVGTSAPSDDGPMEEEP